MYTGHDFQNGGGMTQAIAATFKIDATSVEQALYAFSTAHQQSAALALNQTAEEVLAFEVTQMPGRFHQRVPMFTTPLTQVPRGYRATPEKLEVLIALAYPDSGKHDLGQRKEKALSKYGAEQTLVAQDPIFPFFIPTKALRPNVMGTIASALYPRNMLGAYNSDGKLTGMNQINQAKLTPKGKTRTIKGVKQEGGRYFILGQPGQKDYGIYERSDTGAGGSTGNHHGSVRMLWAFRESESVHKLLDWEAEARRIIETNWPVNAAGALEKAMTAAGLTGFGSNRFSK